MKGRAAPPTWIIDAPDQKRTFHPATPTAPVDVLVVGEKALVERPDALETLPSHQQEAAAHPVHVALATIRQRRDVPAR